MSHASEAIQPQCTHGQRVAQISLRDPARRNALDAPAIASLQRAIGEAAILTRSNTVDVVVLSGEGSSFCAGFDLARCDEDPAQVAVLLEGLSACVRALRAIDAPVIARVQGAALAGGCALITGCDFVVVAADAQLGYPVHRIGISPAVSAVSLFSRMGAATRAFMMSNEIISGLHAHERGLATHVASDDTLDAVLDALVQRLLRNGPQAMRATKAWIRSIEMRGAHDLGCSVARDEAAMDACRDASLTLAQGDEFSSMLRAFWTTRKAPR